MSFSILLESQLAFVRRRTFSSRSLTNELADDPSDEPADDPIDDPIDDPTDDPTDDLTVDPTDDPAEDPADDSADDLTDDPTDDPTEDPTDLSDDINTDDPTNLNSSMDPMKLADPTDDSTDLTVDPTETVAVAFAEERYDFAAMTTAFAAWVSVRTSSTSFAILSESRCAPMHRRAFSLRRVCTSLAATFAHDSSDDSDIFVASRSLSFLSSSRDRNRSDTCARSVSFSARHASSSSASLLVTGLGL